MNLVSSVKHLSSTFNLALRICKPVKAWEPKFSPVISSIILKDDVNSLQNLLSKQETNWLNSYKYQEECFFPVISKTDLTVNKKIIEPEKSIKINIETPLRNNLDNDLQLPCNSEKDMIEPTENIVSKKAINMLRIRAKKMKKHKWRKFMKKMKFEFAKRKARKEIDKEFIFQTKLKEILGKGEKYCPEMFVKDTLEKVNWTKPVTKVRGRLAPQWVIKEHQENAEEKKVLRLRIKECLEFNKLK